MKEEKIINNLENLGRLIKIDENTKIKTRWHLERLIKQKPEPQKSWKILFARRVFVPATSAFILLLSGSWVTMALAEDSLPGEILYPVKRVNENIRLLLATKPEQKAKVRQNIIEKRFYELENIPLPTQAPKQSEIFSYPNVKELEKNLEKASEEIEKFESPNPKQKAVLEKYLQIVQTRVEKIKILEKRYPDKDFSDIKEKLLKLEEEIRNQLSP